ncbi:uncharacterized protein Bfra_009563 [Botrytis fragariae]|uniref:Uncharacterized protein n=1 Tax=Botrytis fragariae TaxID=1964551 RepID=A0A8H6EG34_9HELO|nr:uncharacterized protein Bfra_009563 [Botrytis fragariae]KAF5871007.1 hypothetical protein Bfra_009563 [Botrytis fragariae]
MPLEDMVTDDLFLTQAENTKTHRYLFAALCFMWLSSVSLQPKGWWHTSGIRTKQNPIWRWSYLLIHFESHRLMNNSPICVSC